MTVEWLILFKGVMIGLAVAMPIGPLNVLCITRALQGGFKLAIPVLLGTSLADASYAIVAVLGLTSISGFLIEHQFWLRMIGGLVLLWMAIKAYRTKHIAEKTFKTNKLSFIKDVLIVYGMTISSPLTIVSFAALFASLGMGAFEGSSSTPLFLVAGVMIGTSSWMMSITTISVLVRHKAGDGLLRKLNRIGAVVLLCFALALFASLLFGF